MFILLSISSVSKYKKEFSSTKIACYSFLFSSFFMAMSCVVNLKMKVQRKITGDYKIKEVGI